MKQWCAAVLAALMACAAAAQPFPSKPVKIIVPSAPGDGSDILARAIAQKLTERWGQTVIVENRPGAGGVIGTEAAAKSPADGYTVIMGNAGSHAINQALYAKLPYDVVRDFAPISLVASAPNVFVVNPAVPANTVAEFLALAKKEPGKYAFASGGNGSSAHLNGEMLKAFAGVELTHVPYKGASIALTNILSGESDMVVVTVPATIPFIQAGRLRGLAVLDVKRVPQLPQLPTSI